MKLHELPKSNELSKKRLGRGIGSGRGKTSGRGTKGQKARGKIPASFIGGTLPLYKKLPYRRGYHRDGVHSSSSLSKTIKVINLKALEIFKPKSEINLQSLLEAGLITQRESKVGVKILGGGEIKIPLTIQLPVSKKTQELVEKAGGKIESV
jgi:large subunit ribosomal protein L15